MKRIAGSATVASARRPNQRHPLSAASAQGSVIGRLSHDPVGAYPRGYVLAAGACVVLYGAPGVGKSTVAFEIFARLRSVDVPIARVELDDIGYLYRDMSSADPGGHRLRAQNLASMWPNFRAAGAVGLIVSGAVSDHGQVNRYRAAIPHARWTLCRLRARPETVRSRILARGRLLGVGTPGGISGFTKERLQTQADGAAAYAEQLDQNPLSDLAIDTDGRTVPDIARDVVRQAGNWPDLG